MNPFDLPGPQFLQVYLILAIIVLFVLWQAIAAVWVILFSGAATFVLLKLVGFVFPPAVPSTAGGV